MPSDVLAFVFWSKNFQPFTPILKEIEKDYQFYLHYTITGLSDIFEKHSPNTNDAIENFIRLSERHGRERIIWRFDPIVLSNKTPTSFHKENFKYIAGKLKGYTNKCYFSFVQTHYRKVKREMEKHKDIQINSEQTDEENLLGFMQKEAKNNKLALYSCCQPEYEVGDIQRANCINKEIIEGMLNNKNNAKIKKTPTRKHCGCYQSTDIGVYNTCPNECIYCYASTRNTTQLQN